MPVRLPAPCAPVVHRSAEIRAGDAIWCPPGHKHCHDATSTTAMTHIAMQEALDGRAVHWLEPVTDAHYLALTQTKDALQ